MRRIKGGWPGQKWLATIIKTIINGRCIHVQYFCDKQLCCRALNLNSVTMMTARTRKRVRFSFDIYFDETEQKERFVCRLKEAKRRLASVDGDAELDNLGLMSAMLDILDSVIPGGTAPAGVAATTKSVMRDSGEYETVHIRLEYWYAQTYKVYTVAMLQRKRRTCS